VKRTARVDARIWDSLCDVQALDIEFTVGIELTHKINKGQPWKYTRTRIEEALLRLQETTTHLELVKYKKDSVMRPVFMLPSIKEWTDETCK
jgi:hypothetical protein